MIIATAGHVDHGKTALVKALTGIETDRLAEEKRRGMTIELGFAYHATSSGAVVGFVDVPGHERLVRNMVAGVAGVGFVLLVVAADDGVMPQTREHVDIVDLLGLGRGAVAINKADLVEPARLAAVEREVAALLAGTALAGAPVFCLSAVTGQGVAALSAHLEAEAARPPGTTVRGHFRLAIDRVFTLAGAGLIVTGAAASGRVRPGDTLTVSPGGGAVRVRGLRAQDRESDEAQAGARCAVNLTGPGASRDSVRRGMWLLAPEIDRPTARFDASVKVSRQAAAPLANWTPVHVHIGAEDVTGRVALLGRGAIAPGETGHARIALDRMLPILAGDRFVLRDQSARHTLAGGRAIDPFAPARGRARPERLAAIAAQDTGDDAAALAGLLAVAPGGVDLGAFAGARNLTASELAAVLSSVAPLSHGAAAIAPTSMAALKARLVDALKTYHAGHPERLGPDARALRRLAGTAVFPDILEAALAALVEEGAVARRGGLVHHADFSPRLSPRHEKAFALIEPVLEAAGDAPPVTHEIAKLVGLPAAEVASALTRAEALGLVTRVGRNRFALPTTLERLAAIAVRLAGESGLTAGAFRDAAGIGRNLAIEFLEHFDRVGLTARAGDMRYLRPRAPGKAPL